MKLRVSLKREIVLTLTFKKLYEKYSDYFLSWYFRPSITEYGVPSFIYPEDSVEDSELKNEMIILKNNLNDPKEPTQKEKKEYEEILENAMKRKLSRYPETLHEKYALARYEVLKVIFGGLGWSVLPEYKKKWKIDQELFGNFLNTNGKFCSIFPELEGCGCQFGTIEPQNGIHYLVNPPFQIDYLRWVCVKILEWLKQDSLVSVKFTVVIPVWDPETRKKLKLKDYGPFDELKKLLHSKYVTNHYVSQMKFWDSINNKIQYQKSYIHKITLEK
jgi:hypothetical protein